MHLNDGQLRASLDHEANEQEIEHLLTCVQCQSRRAELSNRFERASRSLSILGSHHHTITPSVSSGRARLESYITQKGKSNYD